MTAKVPIKYYSVREEIANSISHGAGVIFGVVAMLLLVFRAAEVDDRMGIASFSIYGASIITLFLASTLYHAIPYQRSKRVLKTFDHCAIYLLIAGTYTPFLLLLLGNRLGAILMAVIWALAVMGIVFKIFFVNRFHNLSLITYLGMGWLALFAGWELMHRLPPLGLGLLLAGGIIYSLGTIFYQAKRIPFNHAIWHLFVLGGCVCQFLVVYLYLTPQA